MLHRREFLTAAGLAIAGLAVPDRGWPADMIEIHMRNDASRVHAWFDPIGVLVTPGQTVRWILDMDVHATAAYHPKNAMHSLRIPEGAASWDSGLMNTKGRHFDVTFTVEGVYDYFCLPHENDGMVGRIIVGKPGGPGTLPFDYYKGKPGTHDWVPVPAVARKAFHQILAQNAVHHHV